MRSEYELRKALVLLTRTVDRVWNSNWGCPQISSVGWERLMNFCYQTSSKEDFSTSFCDTHCNLVAPRVSKGPWVMSSKLESCSAHFVYQSFEFLGTWTVTVFMRVTGKASTIFKYDLPGEQQFI